MCTHCAGNACLLPVSIGDIVCVCRATLILRVASFDLSFARKSTNGKSYSVISEGKSWGRFAGTHLRMVLALNQLRDRGMDFCLNKLQSIPSDS